jgi:hypothetical protein
MALAFSSEVSSDAPRHPAIRQRQEGFLLIPFSNQKRFGSVRVWPCLESNIAVLPNG